MSFLNKLTLWCRQEMVQHMPFALMAYMMGILAFFYFKRMSLVVWIFVGLGAVSVLMTRRHLVLSWFCGIVFFFFLGFTNIYLHAKYSGYYALKQPEYQIRIEATVAENQPLPEKQILTLEKIRWPSPDLKLPQKIKVHFKSGEPLLHSGDKVKLLASLYPPDENFSPAYAYQLKFAGIGATGIAEEVQVLNPACRTSFLFEMRRFIHKRLFQILPPLQAEVATPLITGEQKLVSPTTYQIYRRAGIAHVLSVSGFHMALLAGFLFFVIQSLLALFPRIVLYYNTKKLAAVIAFFGTFLYLGLSGFQVPAVRAFLMISFVFFGVLIERSVLSMHSLILVAFGVLLFAPQMLLSISFQLSFMAVVVLVSFCQYLSHQSWPKSVKSVVGFVGLNFFVCAALTPFILYHFHQGMPYGLMGNMVFSSAFSCFIMPLLFLGCLLMPLGMDAPFFHLAGWGLEKVYFAARKLAYLPYSEIITPTYSAFSLGSICFGILMICWMKTPLKWLGGLLIMVGILLGIWA